MRSHKQISHSVSGSGENQMLASESPSRPLGALRGAALEAIGDEGFGDQTQILLGEPSSIDSGIGSVTPDELAIDRARSCFSALVQEVLGHEAGLEEVFVLKAS